MLGTNEQTEEKDTGPESLAAKLEEAGPAAEPDPDSIETPKPQGETDDSPRKRRAFRWVVLLLALSLAGAGYAFRGRLFRLVSKDAAQTSKSAERKVLYWVDPMHPAYKSDKPGTAPDCGMDLVPVYEGGAQATANFPAGTVQITADRQQLIGVQYGEAVYKPVSKTLRTVGRVAYDETKITHVHTKYEGWVEEVFVDFTGKAVEKGQKLLSVYSPELLQTQQEFLLARRGRAELSDSPFREAVYGANSLYEAARKRLELWDVTDEQIKELEHSGKPVRALLLFAPAGGVVTARNAYPRQRVTPETELYTVADLSNVWVIADVYEAEAPEVKLGQSVTVTLTYFPGRSFRGKVSYIYPQLDNSTRTLKARVEVPNPGLLLKPDMYADIEFKIDYGRHVVVPQEAVMDSGAEQQVFVAHEGGYFEPRPVTLGVKVDKDVIVLGGLKAGEIVVTSANFLIDSESKLKSATGGMGVPGGHSHGAAAPSSSQPGQQVDHSQHKAGPTKPTPDHSQHQTGGQPTPKSEDHSRHQPQAATQPQAEDHSAHSKAAAEHDHARQTGKVLYYYCPMHAEQRSDKPGECPKCKMRLIPKHATSTEGGKL
jgi:Cu(I)/Ag(I) efflux system membrane fusion protein